MTSTSVRDAVYGMGNIANTSAAKNTESTQSGELDFGKIMNQVKDKTKQTVHQSDKQMAEKKAAPEQKEMQGQENKAALKTDKPATKEEVSEKKPISDTTEKQNVSEAEPVDEELEAAVEEAVKEIVKEVMQEVEETLEVSEEELLEVIQQLGLQPMDLLNPDNMASIMTSLTGEDSTIQLVMDEDMYQTLQDLMQMVDEKTQELLSSTGLSDEELEAVLDQLKLLIEQQVSREENGMQEAKILPFEQPKPFSDMAEPMEEGKVPVIIKDDTDNNVQESPNLEKPEKTAEVMVEDTHVEKEAGEREESSFQQQQNMQNFQNMNEEIAELAQESKIQDSNLPNTESILKQLADFVKIQNGKELTEMELQLHPASLGNVRVILSTKGGVVTAQLTTENEVVKNAIESQVSQLKLNLEEQGIKVEAIEVSVASHQMERNLEQNAGERQNQEQTDKANGIHKIRKTSINLNSYENEEELIEDITDADDATRIAMEMMAIGGNRMDLLA